ncbi:Hint domain-containing protein [Rhodovulum marinum]|uniref:Hint domain-containing protein n=1 Tax=Rhodovulum marinum TaxID=320662 RepID=A0A4R2QBW9_9RHOB|nr:Hint domain-containing protein [Rhodovulum marinum]
MPTIYLWEKSDITSIGPDVFSDTQDANGGAVGNSTFSIGAGSVPVAAEITDDDTFFADGDASGQTLAAPVAVNGATFPAGTAIKVDYAYIVRPAGSTDPADEITVYGVKIGNHIEAAVSDAEIMPGVTYEVVSIDSNQPAIAYSDLYVCFAEGTRILTGGGESRIEALRPGDPVLTADHGMQPLLWVGCRRVRAEGAAAPVVFAPGALGNRHRLCLSPQHRVLTLCGGREVLVAAKAFVGLPGVTVQAGGVVTYFHLLFARHEILFAEGALAESLNPGSEAWKRMTPATRAWLEALCPQLAAGPLDPARPIMGPSAWRRAQGLGQMVPVDQAGPAAVSPLRTRASRASPVSSPKHISKSPQALQEGAAQRTKPSSSQILR